MGFTRLLMCAREDVVPVSGREFGFFSPALRGACLQDFGPSVVRWKHVSCCIVYIFARVFWGSNCDATEGDGN